MSQLPIADDIYLDHVGHFVADVERARAALEQAGFNVTPFSAQVAPTGPDGALEPTGTGNICAMLREGYIEVLAQTADTALGREFAKAIARRRGIHLAAFAVADAEKASSRLAEAGFPTRPLVHMSRPIDTENGPSEARFTVARIEAGPMPEGRIQILTHHTEAEVWQPRWLNHPNGVIGLLSLVVISDDPADAVERFSRFLGGSARPDLRGYQFIQLDRGQVVVCSAPAAREFFVEWQDISGLAGYCVRVQSLDEIQTWMGRAELEMRQIGHALIVRFPDALGIGFWMFVEDAADLPWS